MIWVVIAAVSVAVGFLVGRLALPLLIFLVWFVYAQVHHPPRFGDEDIDAIGWFVVMIFAVGGTTIGVVARWAFRWARRPSG